MARGVCLLQGDDHQCNIHVLNHLQGCAVNDEYIRYICYGTGSPSWFKLGSFMEKILGKLFHLESFPMCVIQAHEKIITF